jgi:hypothetical protein
MQSVVDMKIEDGKYLFEAFSRPPGETRVANASLYEVRIGLRYEF